VSSSLTFTRVLLADPPRHFHSSLDPSHLPGLERTSNPRTGQAVKTSVSSLHSHPSHQSQQDEKEAEADSFPPRSGSQPSWKGAWARRQEAKILARRKELGLESDAGDTEEAESRRGGGGDGKIPIPPIPDLRYEQGILASIRPFLHSGMTRGKGKEVEKESEKHELKVEAAEKTALASAQLTAEGDKTGRVESDVLMGPLRVEWGNVTYVLLRDQVNTFSFRRFSTVCDRL